MVTAFCSLTTTGADEAVVQATGESRFVVNCKVNPAAFAAGKPFRTTNLTAKVQFNHVVLADGKLADVSLPE